MDKPLPYNGFDFNSTARDVRAGIATGYARQATNSVVWSRVPFSLSNPDFGMHSGQQAAEPESPPIADTPERPVRSRLRIVRSEYLRPAALPSAHRVALIDQLYGIYRDTGFGCSRVDFAADVCTDDVIVVFYGAGNVLAGFLWTVLDRIEHAGRVYALMDAGVFIRPDYVGGQRALTLMLWQAMMFKFRQPRMPLAGVAHCSVPEEYRLLAAVMPRLYPSPDRQTPADVEALLCIAAERGGAGNGSMLVWIPLDVANIVGGLCGLLRTRFVQRARRMSPSSMMRYLVSWGLRRTVTAIYGG